MHTQARKPFPVFFATLTVSVFCSLFFWLFLSRADGKVPEWNDNSSVSNVTLWHDGLPLTIQATSAKTVNELLQEQHIAATDDDIIYPKSTEALFSNSSVYFYSAKSLTLIDGLEKKSIIAHGRTIADALAENNLTLDELDLVTPTIDTPLDLKIKTVTITRLVKKTETKEEVIPFTTKSSEDDSLGWRVKKVTQKGEKGMKWVDYEVLFQNGKEVRRKIINTEIAQDPVTEIVTQGTLMKLGKTNTGWGTWYTQPKNMVYSYPQENGMTAASPWIGIGNYVKVTNKENGKSVVVRINDRGPFGKNRIIDINTPAFQKIASLGSGVIDVKVEEILN